MSAGHARPALFAVPAIVFMGGMFLVPLAGIVRQSVTTADGELSLESYRSLFGSELFYRVGWTTLSISLLATAVSFVLAYPLALYLSRQTARKRAWLMIFVLVPFWTSVLVKTFAFTVLLGRSGVVNTLLMKIGLPAVPFLFNRSGVVIGMTHFLIPFLVFPILASLLKQPPELARAAELMGAGRTRIFFQVTFPLSMPGVMAGLVMVLILSLGFFVIPALLGGRSDMMLGNLVDFYTRESLDWQLASTVALVLVLLAALAVVALSMIPGGSGLLGSEKD